MGYLGLRGPGALPKKLRGIGLGFRVSGSRCCDLGKETGIEAFYAIFAHGDNAR